MGKFKSFEASDKPLRIELIDPVTGKTITDNAGAVSYIEAHAEDSLVGRQFDKESRAERIENVRKGRVPADAPIDQLDLNRRKCAALTTAWHLVDPDTREPIDVACNRDNAYEFYSLPATNWFVQVWVKVIDNGNFMKRSAQSSPSTQSGSSDAIAA